MPPLSLSTLNTRVRRWVHQPTASTSMFTDNLLTNVINAAYMKRWQDLDTAHEGRFVRWYEEDIQTGVYEYQWPKNHLRTMRMEYVASDGTRTPIQREERHAASLQPDSSYLYDGPYTYRPVSRGYVLEPTPQDGTGRIRIEFVAMPSYLVNDADEISADFPEIFGELIVLDAAVALLDSEGQLEDGSARAALRQRKEWEDDWKKYIKRLVVARDKIEPWNPHYEDY